MLKDSKKIILSLIDESQKPGVFPAKLKVSKAELARRLESIAFTALSNPMRQLQPRNAGFFFKKEQTAEIDEWIDFILTTVKLTFKDNPKVRGEKRLWALISFLQKP